MVCINGIDSELVKAQHVKFIDRKLTIIENDLSMRFVWVQRVYSNECKCHSVALCSLKMYAPPGLYWQGSRGAANSLPVGCMSTAQLFPPGRKKHITRGFTDTVDNRMNTFRVVLFDGCTSKKNFPMWHHKLSEKKKKRFSPLFFPKPVRLPPTPSHRIRAWNKKGNPLLPHQKFKHSTEFELHILQWHDLE